MRAGTLWGGYDCVGRLDRVSFNTGQSPDFQGLDLQLLLFNKCLRGFPGPVASHCQGLPPSTPSLLPDRSPGTISAAECRHETLHLIRAA